MTILSNLPPKLLIKSVREKAMDNLTSVPGIGKKSAERLMIELSSSIDKLLLEFEGILINSDMVSTKASNTIAQESEAFTALLTLGFKHHEIRKVMTEVNTAELASEEIIRQALRLLSR